jgi:hypothetical protein
MQISPSPTRMTGSRAGHASCLITLPLVAVVVLIAAATSPAQAQTGWRNDTAGEPEGVGRYEIRTGPEDKLTIDVQIWGQVNRPGQYFVPDRTDLVGLISYAGGPTEDAKLRNVQVLRPTSSTGRVHRVNLEAFMVTGDPELIPRLTPGDVVVVPASRSRSVTRMAGIVSVLALVANVALLATRH